MSIKQYYEHKYKKLLWIPFIMLILAFVQIGMQYQATGDFVNKGVSLKGGSTITIEYNSAVSPDQLQNYLDGQFPQADILVRTLGSAGQPAAYAIDSDAQETKEIDNLINSIGQKIPLTKENHNVEVIGSALGNSFFEQTAKALLVAFILMGVVVFWIFSDDKKYKAICTVLGLIAAFIILGSNNTSLHIFAYIIAVALFVIYYKKNIPSFAVVLAAVSDIIITLAIFNLTGIKLSTAGIAAFLMLIGYSVDTDILLSNKVLKRKDGTVMERIYTSMQTGLTMSFTTIFAVFVALIFVKSDIVKQIMIILFIGLIVDIIMTYIQNVGILRLYLEKKK
jgi:preprotein translocase subunit SecF